ncbi:coiled-coil domain-containing protein 40 isoform X2 [Cynoglossus semilaevis]|uniref:coiled-coil domain-containing protein 40 isoform X2 n=1 Tax=Cynoglossus semilaevis TaxID=244447 RepID=UPI000495176B|nr:coiled-coil domain-containing protein 40-like isoform X2 [Cynoglossus semilaevis]
MEGRGLSGEDDTQVKETEERTVTEGPTEPENDGSGPQPHRGLSGVEQNSAAATDYEPNTSEDLEGEELLQKDEEEEEEEELLVLDPEHPLVKKQQAALTKHLKRQLEKINLEMKEKLVQEKQDDRHREETGVEMFRIQEQLSRLHSRLEEQHQTKEQAEAKHRQALDQLEEAKSKYSNIASHHGRAKASVSELQVEMDNLMLHLLYTQGVSEDLRSNVKALMNVRSKASAEKNQAEDKKLQQDLYVDRLTKELDRLTQQIALYQSQARVQAEETRAARQAESEAEMEMVTVEMVRKQLLQQWRSSLVDMRRRNDGLTAMREALRLTEHQLILLDREIDGYKKSITEEQEQNETLTLQLNWSQMDAASSKKLLSQKQAQYEALQNQYSTCVRILRETEGTLARLTKETTAHQTEVNNQRRQLEKESALRLELEEKIMVHMQQQLTFTKAAKYSQQLTSRTRALKKQKMSQLWQLENDLLVVELEITEVSEQLDALTVAQKAMDEEIAKFNQSLTSNLAKNSSFIKVIEQKQSSITDINRKIAQIAASTGHEDLSPLQIKLEALKMETEELQENMRREQQLWMKQQGILVGLTQENDANSKNMVKLQMEFTAMQQKKIRLEKQLESEQQELTDLERNMKTLRRDLLKLNTLLSNNRQLSQALEQENVLMETDFIHTLKEEQQESVEMQMKVEKTEEEKERLLYSLVEAERQVMLWEKKIQLVKETRSAVDFDVGQGEIHRMKAEIHRMEVRLNQLKKQQEQLVRESEATVARRETLVLRREVMDHSSHKQTSKGDLSRHTLGLQRKIKDTHKNVAECEQGIKELQENQQVLSQRLADQKQQLVEVCSSSSSLDQEYRTLQDTKDQNISHLVALQSRVKRLQAVHDGSYQALSTRESVEASVQCQREQMQATKTILHRVGQEFPHHQGALRRLSLALAAQTQTLDQEMWPESQ